MSEYPIETHARAIRRAVAGLRAYSQKAIEDGEYGSARRAQRACDALEDAIHRTLPLLGMEPALTEEEVDAGVR